MKSSGSEEKLLLLFDIDGTLVHADGAGREALRLAMIEVYGESGPIDSFDFNGRTDPAIVRELLRAVGREDPWIDEGMSRLWARYVGALEIELDRRYRRRTLRIYPGVGSLLRRVSGDPRLVAGLVTGNVEAGAWAKLRASGLATAFAFGAFGSDSECRADLPPLAMRRAHECTGAAFRPDRVLVIGDTPEDIRCARASGACAVAVATGGYSEAELAAHGADTVVPALTALDPLLDAMLETC